MTPSFAAFDHELVREAAWIARCVGRAETPYTARALEDSLCLVLEPGPFERLLLENAPIARRWLSSCVARLAGSHARVIQLLGRSLPQQLARLLLDEAVDNKIRLPQRTLAPCWGSTARRSTRP